MANLSQLLWLAPTTNVVPDINTYIQQNIDKYADTPSIANQFKNLWSLKNSTLNDARNNIVNAYSLFEESTNPAFRNYIWTALSSGKKMLADIDKQKSNVESFYGTWWTAENLINDYVTNYGNAITQQSAWAQSLAKNIWIKSWASESATLAWVNEQKNAYIWKMVELQEKKVTDLTNLYNTYNTLISSLRNEASNVNQSYVLQPLAQILDRQSTIAQALVSNEASLNEMKVKLWLAKATATATNPLAWFTQAQWNDIKTNYNGYSDSDKQTIQNYINWWWDTKWVSFGTGS